MFLRVQDCPVVPAHFLFCILFLRKLYQFVFGFQGEVLELKPPENLLHIFDTVRRDNLDDILVFDEAQISVELLNL